MDPQQLRRIVAQHAETARLFGAESVPVFRSGVVEVPAGVGDSSVGAGEQTVDSRFGDAPASVATPGSSSDAQRAMDELRAEYERDAPHEAFDSDRNRSFTNIVWGDGDVCARLMFVGEAPGADEDRVGVPFVGRAGQLLNKMIEAMGLRREDVYIANVLKIRPPNNATPTADEAERCAPYLYRQIEIIQPEVIVTLGLPAVKTLLGTSESMGRLRGRWAEFRSPGGLTIPLMPTYHPAYLLRSYTPENRKMVWSDLQMAMDRLGLAETAGS